MKSSSILLLLAGIAALNPAQAQTDCGCGESFAATPAESSANTQGHPFKGIVVDVRFDKTALLVKHEAVPGVMGAMTMLLKVDAAVFRSAALKKGVAITGRLIRETEGWRLDDVKFKDTAN